MAPAPAGCTRGWNLYIVHADRIINICLHFIPKYLDRIFPNSSMPVRQSAPSELRMKMFWSLSSLVPFISLESLSKLRKQTKTIILAAEVYVDFLQDFSDKLRSQTSRGRT